MSSLGAIERVESGADSQSRRVVASGGPKDRRAIEPVGLRQPSPFKYSTDLLTR